MTLGSFLPIIMNLGSELEVEGFPSYILINPEGEVMIDIQPRGNMLEVVREHLLERTKE